MPIAQYLALISTYVVNRSTYGGSTKVVFIVQPQSLLPLASPEAAPR